ncbi:MAG: peptide-binding protein [Candidatus Omnitrophica bacterium]|nr:peptide-binding protein [Candidatus Omnitrophota bacterium]
MYTLGMRLVRLKRSLSVLIVTFFFNIFLFENCVFPEGEIGARDAFVSASIADARTLIPIFADDSNSASICELVYSGLVKVDGDLNIIGDLAEKWDISEDGLVITFYLRKNVKWHDGKGFTAEDVKFTYETILDPKTGCPYISSYIDIKKIEVIDAYTIRFYYKQPYAPALSKFGMGIIPEHIFKNTGEMRKSTYARSPIGTGPYKFSKWEPGQYVVLEADENYYEHIPGIKRFVYRIIPDQSVEFLEMVTGGIDSMSLSPYQYFYRSNTEEFKKKINKFQYISHSYIYIGYNLKDPLFKDKKVRQALSYAVNRKEIIDSILLGLGEKCTGPFLKGTPYYDESVAGYDHNPEKAKKLLFEAGWYDADNDGILEKNGQKFHFRLVTNQGNQIREDAAAIIQNEWLKVGIKVDIQVIAWSSFLDQFINKKNFQAVILGWTIPLDPDIHSVWHSDSISGEGLNFISYSNKSVDKLIMKGRREFNPEERAKIYKKIHSLISEDAPYTFLFFPYATPAVNKRFEGVKAAPAGISYNFIDWYVPESEVKYKF